MQYMAAIRSLEKQFKGFTLQHIERNKNEEDDTLAKAAAKGETLAIRCIFHIVGTPAVRNPEGLRRRAPDSKSDNGRRLEGTNQPLSPRTLPSLRAKQSQKVKTRKQRLRYSRRTSLQEGG